MTLTCSANRRAIGEPLAGTAPHARLWVLLEQPGPWGRAAPLESRLPTQVGQALTELTESRPVRLGLIRAVGTHADGQATARTLLVARTDADHSWLAARSITDVEALPGELDIAALLTSDGVPGALPGEPLPTPVSATLVCTNAKRDQCCAMLGRPLAASMAADAELDTQVWETSHTGGHRFAPTFASLPDGYLFGGPNAASRSLDACRGRSALPPAAQVAELAVLRERGARLPRPLSVARSADDSYLVRDGAAVFTVRVTLTPGPDRPESCGKQPVPSSWFSTTVTPSNV